MKGAKCLRFLQSTFQYTTCSMNQHHIITTQLKCSQRILYSRPVLYAWELCPKQGHRSRIHIHGAYPTQVPGLSQSGGAPMRLPFFPYRALFAKATVYDQQRVQANHLLIMPACPEAPVHGATAPSPFQHSSTPRLLARMTSRSKIFEGKSMTYFHLQDL